MVILPHRRKAFSGFRFDGAANLVLRWRMDEASGNCTDSNTAGAGSRTGVVLNSPSRVAGKYGSGLALVRASNQFVEEASDDMSFFDTSFTLMCWVYPAAWGPSGNFSAIFRKGLEYNSGGTHYLVEALLADNGKVLGHFWGAAGGGGGAVLPLNTWSHVALARTPTQVAFFVNGVADGSPYAVNTAPGGTYNRHVIGKAAYFAHANFDGRVDDYRAYNRVLLAAEIASIAAGTDLQTP